jgi:hypothetical protein
MAHRMTRPFALASTAVAIAAFIGCSGTPGQYTGGLVSSPSAAFAVQTTLPNTTLIALSRGGCPAAQPFTTNINLVLGPSNNDFFLQRLALRIGDPFGRSSMLFFTADELALLFGNTRVRTGTLRTFALQPQFGCGLSRPRSIDATIDLVDALGLTHQTTATATLQ